MSSGKFCCVCVSQDFLPGEHDCRDSTKSRIFGAIHGLPVKATSFLGIAGPKRHQTARRSKNELALLVQSSLIDAAKMSLCLFDVARTSKRERKVVPK